MSEKRIFKSPNMMIRKICFFVVFIILIIFIPRTIFEAGYWGVFIAALPAGIMVLLWFEMIPQTQSIIIDENGIVIDYFSNKSRLDHFNSSKIRIRFSEIIAVDSYINLKKKKDYLYIETEDKVHSFVCHFLEEKTELGVMKVNSSELKKILLEKDNFRNLIEKNKLPFEHRLFN